MTPRQPGSYVLIMHLSRRVALDVGRLGRFDFPAGWYAYAGSARGPGGLAARIGRHRRRSKTPHWHVDRLRAWAELAAVWYSLGSRKRECNWARALSELPGARLIAPGFGASDCGCSAHLVHLAGRPDRSLFAQLVGDRILEDVLSV